MSRTVQGPAAPVSGCAQAATAKEAAFRIDYPLAAARNTRVVALDDVAADTVRRAATHEWAQARFYTATDPGHRLVTVAGTPGPLADEIADSNALIIVSATGENSEAAATIGSACLVRGIMTAALILTPGQVMSSALRALRPYARMILVPADDDDLVELLKATRA
ncbi:hypothetical protein ACWEKT_35655 [Nocardia takedensis]